MTFQDQISDYEVSTSILLHALSEVSDENLDRHGPGAWSARQVIHHVADSEAQSYARLRRLLAEPAGSIIQGYDEAAWALSPELGYTELPIEHSLAVFRAVRQASYDILGRLRESDLERNGVHSEIGYYSVATWLNIYTEHPRIHAAQLTEAISS